MPEQIIGSPNQNMLVVNNSGAIPIAGYSNGVIIPFLVDDTGGFIVGTSNTYTTLEYIISGADTGLTTGSAIGSITEFIGLGSRVKALTYDNNNLINIGSWI